MTTWSTRVLKPCMFAFPSSTLFSYYLCIENYSAMKKSNYETVSFNWNARHIYHFPFFLSASTSTCHHINIKFAIFSYLLCLLINIFHDHLSDVVCCLLFCNICGQDTLFKQQRFELEIFFSVQTCQTLNYADFLLLLGDKWRGESKRKKNLHQTNWVISYVVDDSWNKLKIEITTQNKFKASMNAENFNEVWEVENKTYFF